MTPENSRFCLKTNIKKDTKRTFRLKGADRCFEVGTSKDVGFLAHLLNSAKRLCLHARTLPQKAVAKLAGPSKLVSNRGYLLCF